MIETITPMTVVKCDGYGCTCEFRVEGVHTNPPLPLGWYRFVPRGKEAVHDFCLACMERAAASVIGIQWSEQPWHINDRHGPYWHAPSPLLGWNKTPYRYRIAIRVSDGRMEFYCASDPECCGGCDQSWPTLTEAKAEMEKLNETILRELENV